MGIQTNDTLFSFVSNLKLLKTGGRVTNENCYLPIGKTLVYKNHCIETIFTLKNEFDKVLKVFCRAINDGVDFRYKIDQPGLKITNELTTMYLDPASESWLMDYTPSYDRSYMKNT